MIRFISGNKVVRFSASHKLKSLDADQRPDAGHQIVDALSPTGPSMKHHPVTPMAAREYPFNSTFNYLPVALTLVESASVSSSIEISAWYRFTISGAATRDKFSANTASSQVRSSR